MTDTGLLAPAPDFLSAPPPALPGLLRERIRPLLPGRAFLRRARTGGLFITNAPRFAPPESLIRDLERLHLSYACAEGLLTLSPDARMLLAFERAHPATAPQDWTPAGALCASLARTAGAAPGKESLNLFAAGLRLLESAASSEIMPYQRRVRELAALCLRTGEGGAYACAVVARALSTES